MVSLVVIPGCGSQVLAQTRGERVASQSAGQQGERMERLKEKANREIDRRVRVLNGLLARLSEAPKVQNADKATLVDQINSQVAGLTALKSKIAADTDFVTLRNDVQSIRTQYRVFVLIIPKVHIIIASARVSAASDELLNVSTALETKLAEAKNAGKNTVALESLLSEVQKKITDAKNEASSANVSTIKVTPTQFNSNKEILQSPRQSLQSAKEDLQSARRDALKIREALKSL